MAGGAGEYLVDGVHYSLISTALAQLATDEDGTPTTETQYITLSIDVTESSPLAIPAVAALLSTLSFPVVIRSANPASPNTWTISTNNELVDIPSGNFGRYEFKDLIINGYGSNQMIFFAGGSHDNSCQPIKLEGCTVNTNNLSYVRDMLSFHIDGSTINCSGVLFQGSPAHSGQIYISQSKIACAGMFNGAALQHVCIDSSAIKSSAPLSDTTTYYPSFTIRNSAVYFSTPSYVFKRPLTNSAYSRAPMLVNCIVDNALGFEDLGSNYRDSCGMEQNYAGNIWSNLQGSGNFIESADDVATLAAYQALGYEQESTTAAVSFASTTLSNSGFLKPTTATLGRNVGIHAGLEGNARQNWLVEIGAYQQTAATYDAAKVLATATPPGTFDEAARNTDPGIANVLAGTSYKIQNTSYTGTFDEEARNTDPGIANVKLGTEYLIYGATLTGTLTAGTTGSQTGTLDVDAYAEAYEAGRNTDMQPEHVEKDYAYESYGESRVGTLEGGGSAPSVPTLTIVDNGDDTGAVATIAGADSGTTNTVYVAAYGSSVWSSAGSRTGNGTVALDLDAGVYAGYVVSSNGQRVVSSIVVFSVTTGAETDIDKILTAMKAMIDGENYHDANGDLVETRTPITEYPIKWINQDAAGIVILPEGDPATPNTTGSNSVTYNITVAISESLGTGTEATFASHAEMRQAIRRLFLGKRLITFTDAVVSSATASEFFNQDQAANQLAYLPISFEVEVVESRE